MTFALITLILYGHSHSHSHANHATHTSDISYTTHTSDTTYTTHTNKAIIFIPGNVYISSYNNRIIKTYITSTIISDIILLDYFYKHENYGQLNEENVIYNITYLSNFTIDNKICRCLYYYKILNIETNETLFVTSNNIQAITNPSNIDNTYISYCIFTYKLTWIDNILIFITNTISLIIILIFVFLLIATCRFLLCSKPRGERMV